MSSLKSTILEAVKAAMRAKETLRLGTLRMLTAAIKQVEIDQAVSLDNDDEAVCAVIGKMIKQRRDAIAQYQAGNRPELAEAEAQEIEWLSVFLPPALSKDELSAIIETTIGEVGATSPKDIGRLMPLVREKVGTRADMAEVSALIKSRLSGGR